MARLALFLCLRISRNHFERGRDIAGPIRQARGLQAVLT
jgi:hypothetical protein